MFIEEIIINNKKIAFFMGGTSEMINLNPDIDYPFEIIKFSNYTCEPSNLNYHDDWNKLIEVKEKIESMGYETMLTYDPNDSYYFSILKNDKVIVSISSDINLIKQKQIVYLGILKFIDLLK